MSEEREIRAALRANHSFYAALSQGDYPAMEAVWSASESILCNHPGAPTLRGREAVMASWQAILAEPPAVEASEAQVVVIRGLAFVTCLEAVEDVCLCATNVFVWEDGRWRMVHHQSGQLASAPASRGGQPLH